MELLHSLHSVDPSNIDTAPIGHFMQFEEFELENVELNVPFTHFVQFS